MVDNLLIIIDDSAQEHIPDDFHLTRGLEVRLERVYGANTAVIVGNKSGADHVFLTPSSLLNRGLSPFFQAACDGVALGICSKSASLNW